MSTSNTATLSIVAKAALNAMQNIYRRHNKPSIKHDVYNICDEILDKRFGHYDYEEFWKNPTFEGRFNEFEESNTPAEQRYKTEDYEVLCNIICDAMRELIDAGIGRETITYFGMAIQLKNPCRQKQAVNEKGLEYIGKFLDEKSLFKFTLKGPKVFAEKIEWSISNGSGARFKLGYDISNSGRTEVFYMPADGLDVIELEDEDLEDN